MIRSKDLNLEIKQLELTAEKSGDEKALLRAIVKGVTLLLKVIRDMKTNQVLRLKKDGIVLIKDNRQIDTKDNVRPNKKEVETV